MISLSSTRITIGSIRNDAEFGLTSRSSCLTLVLAHSAPLMIAGCGLAGFAFGITYNLMILLSSRMRHSRGV